MSWPWSWLDVASGAVQALAQAPLAGGEFDAPLGSVFDDRIYRLLEKADLIFARRAEREATCQPLILLPAPAEADATISADLSKVLVNVVNAPSSFDWLPYIIMILLSLSACTLLIKLVVFNVRTQHASVQPLGAIYVEDAMPTLNKTDPSFIAILSSTDISTTQEDIDTADSSVTVDTSITVNDSIDAKNNLHVKDQTLAREAQTPTPPPSPMNSHGMKLDDDSSVVNVEPEVDDPAASHENAADSVPVIVRGTRDPVQDVPEPVQDMPNLSVQDMPAPVQDVPEPVQDMPEMALATAAAIDALSFDADLDRDSECDDNSSFDMSGSSADDASGSSADDASGSSANDASSSSADGSFSVEDSMSVDEDDDPTGLSLDVALDPSPQVASSPSSDVAASPSSHVAASPSSDLAPSPSSDVAPSPSSHVAPSPFVDIAPIISPDNDTPSPQDPTPFQASVSAVTDTAAPAEGAMEHTKTSAEDDDAQDIKNIEDGHKDADNHDNNDDDDHFEDRGDGGNENGTNGNNDDPGDSSDGEDKKDDIEGNGDESEDATDTDTDTEDTENVDEAEPCSNMDVPTVAAEVNAIDVALDNTTFLEISESADTEAAAPDEGATDDTMPSAEDDEAHVTRNKYTEKENPTTLGVKLESTTDDVSAPDQADTLEESLDDIPISEASEGAVLESAAPAEDVGKQTTASSEDDEAQVTSIDDAVKNDQVMDDLIDDAPAAVNDGSPDDVEASVHPGAVEDEDEESLGDEGEEVGVDPKVFKEEREPLNELDAHDGADDSDLQGSDMGVSATVAPATLTAKDLRDTILADTTEPPQRTNETYPECSGDQDTSRAADGESTPDIDLASKDADTTSTRHEVAAALAETKLDSEPPNSTEGVVDPAALQHELAQYIGRLNKALKRTVKMADEAYILDGDEAHDVIAGLLVTDIIPERAQELLDAMPRIEAFYFDKVRWVFADEDKWWSEALLTANKAADPRNPRPTASKAALNQSALGVAAKATTSEETTDPVVASTTTSVTPLTVSSSLSTDSSSSPMPSSALDTQSARDALHHQIVAYIGGLNGAVRFLVDKDYKKCVFTTDDVYPVIASLLIDKLTLSRAQELLDDMPRIKAAYFGKDVKINTADYWWAKPLYLINKELYSSTVPTTISQASSTQGTPSPSPAPAPLTSASETVSTSIAPPPRPRTIDEVREGLVAKFNELDRAFKVVLDCKNDIPTEYHVVVADKLIEALGPSEAEKLFNDADELHEKYAVQGWPFYAGSSPRRLAATFDKAKIAARQLSLRDAALASRAARRARIPNKAPSVGTAGPSTASSAPQYAPASDVSETTCPTEAQGNSEIRDSKRRPPTRSMFSGAVRATTHQSAPRPSARAVMSAVDSPSAAPVVVSSSKAPIAPSTPPSMPLPTPQPAPSSTLPLALPPTLPSASTSANPAVHAKYMPPALQAVAQRQDVYAPGHTVSPTASPYNILTRVPDVPPVIDTSRVDDAPRVDDAQHEGLESNTDDGSLTDKGSDDGSLTDRGSRTDGSSDQGGTCLDDGESSYNGDFADSLYNGGVSDDDDGSDRESTLERPKIKRTRRGRRGKGKPTEPKPGRLLRARLQAERAAAELAGQSQAGSATQSLMWSAEAHTTAQQSAVETTRGPVVEILRRPAVETARQPAVQILRRPVREPVVETAR